MSSLLFKATGIFLLAQSCFVSAQNYDECEASLRPTEEKISSNYEILQSYMYVNAKHEYDELKNKSALDRGAAVSYKLFDADYKEAKATSFSISNSILINSYSRIRNVRTTPPS